MLNTLFSDKTDFRTMKTVMDEVEHDIVKRKGGQFLPKISIQSVCGYFWTCSEREKSESPGVNTCP